MSSEVEENVDTEAQMKTNSAGATAEETTETTVGDTSSLQSSNPAGSEDGEVACSIARESIGIAADNSLDPAAG